METNNSNNSPNEKNYYYLKGILYSNAFALIAYFITYFLTNLDSNVGGILIFSNFVLLPIAMGIIAMKFWIHVTERISRLLGIMVINTLVGLALSAVFMGEGIICLIIVFPLLLVFMWCGLLLGKHLFLNNNRTLKASTALLFVIIFIYDSLSVHSYTNMVADEITINAPKDVVWKYIAAYPVNTSEPDYWLFKVGLPNPIQSTVTGDSVGACRKCIFSNNAVFDEKIVEYKKDSVFTFDITKQPEDPEIIGHIEIQRGQFILKDNGDGTTTLIGNSWYKLNVFPVWYYDWWAVDITRNVHLRVMKHIKNLSENDV